MVDSEAILVEAHYIDEAGRWAMNEYRDVTEVLSLPAVGVAIPLQEIYEGVKI